MFGLAAIIAFTVALILRFATIHEGVFLTATTFTIIGLLSLAIHLSTSWGHRS
jgi:hypothetical protein